MRWKCCLRILSLWPFFGYIIEAFHPLFPKTWHTGSGSASKNQQPFVYTSDAGPGLRPDLDLCL